MKLFGRIKRFFSAEKELTLMDAKRKEMQKLFRETPQLQKKFSAIYGRFQENISEDELNEMYTVLTNYESREEGRKWYLEVFEKDGKLQKLYPELYQQLQREASEEEWNRIKSAINKCRETEDRKTKLLRRLEKEEELKEKYPDMYAVLPSVVSDEELKRYETILHDYEGRKSARNACLGYLCASPKLKEKYAKEYELLQKDLSVEEINDISVLIHYEHWLILTLNEQYDDYVRELTEENYASGKVEKLYQGYVDSTELFEKYPEETEELIRHYAPEFDEFFFDKNGKPKSIEIREIYGAKHIGRFKDISIFKEFIERNNVLKQFVLTDKEYNIINDRLRSYIPHGAIRGISGTYTGYSISYEKFLEVKERYPKELAYYASSEKAREDIKDFIDLVYPYLTKSEIRYIV